MAYTSTILLALLVVATTSVGVTTAQVTINGTVTCLATSTGIAGVNVSVSCNGGQTTLAQGVTGVTGTFTVAVNTTISIPSPCLATAGIQARACNGLPTAPQILTSGLVILRPAYLSFNITV